MKFKKVFFVLSAVLFFCAAASIAAAADKEPINIGAIASLTGYLSDNAQA